MAPSYQTQSLFDVNGLVAVITGAGSGIGRVMAHALVTNGAKLVYILGRRTEALETTRATSADPSRIKTIVCDVTSKESLQAAASFVRQDCRYCDVVFANSGISTADVSDVLSSTEPMTIQAVQDGLWQHSMDHFTESFHVNVTGAFYTAVAFIDLLAEGNTRAVVPQTSQVVITTSLGSFSRRPAASFACGPSKAAAGHLAKQLATFLAPFRIRVNAIAPGFYPSEMTANLSFMKAADDPRLEGSISNAFTPLERVGSEEDMAGVVLFLASRAGSYIDGTVLLNRGGRGGHLLSSVITWPPFYQYVAVFYRSVAISYRVVDISCKWVIIFRIDHYMQHWFGPRSYALLST